LTLNTPTKLRGLGAEFRMDAPHLAHLEPGLVHGGLTGAHSPTASIFDVPQAIVKVTT